MSVDPFRIVHDVNAIVNNKAADLESERNHCVGPMEELSVLEAIRAVNDIQLQIQAYLAEELAQLAADIKRDVEYGESEMEAEQRNAGRKSELY